MKIRKRYIALLSSPPPCEKEGSATSTGDFDEDEDEEAAIREEFLLPLVAAAMDVQAKAEAELAEEAACQEIPQIHMRNWRNALLRRNAESEDFQVGGEDLKTNHRWNGNLRPLTPNFSSDREDKFVHLTGKACVKEGSSSSVCQEFSGVDKERDLPKSSRSHKFCVWKEQNIDCSSVKKKRSKEDRISTKHFVIKAVNTESKDAGSKMSNECIQTREKTQDNDNSYYAGSQCRRRNGRGWRCSERTIVGYSLCEHHLGKGRLKSINTTNAAAVVNNKGRKYKELHLI